MFSEAVLNRNRTFIRSTSVLIMVAVAIVASVGFVHNRQAEPEAS